MMRIAVWCLAVTLAAVTAAAEHVWLRDLNSKFDRRNLESAGLPATLRFELARGDYGPGLELNLEENRRLNANAPVFEVDPTADGKQRLVRKESTPIKTTKFYQDKRNSGVFRVTCEIQPGGACLKMLSGNVKISGDSFDLKPLPSIPSLHGKRGQKSEGVLHELVPSEEGIKGAAWSRSRGANVADLKRFPDRHVQQEKKLLEKLKSFLSKRQQYVIAKKLRRSSRRKRATETYAIETVVAIDPALWEKYYSTTSATADLSQDENTELALRQHLAHIINGISLRYESIEDPEMDIYVTLSGFIFYKTVESTNPLPPSTDIPSVDGVNYADVDIYLNSTTTWARELENLPHNDHIAVFTGYDLYSGSISNDDVAGMAWVGGVCTDYRTSVNEDGPYFETVSVAAHEIGHNMNASHDGSDWATHCDNEDKYLMAPMVASFSPDEDYTVNPWRFSQCSIDAFKDYVSTLGDGNCLLDQGDYYNSTEYDSHVSLLPGQLYTVDEQCKLVRGETATLFSDPEAEDICTLMECIDGDGYYWYYAAARGTPCGPTSDNTWCIEGQCVSKSDSHTEGSTGDDSSSNGGTQGDTETETTDGSEGGDGSSNTGGTQESENTDESDGCVDLGYEGYNCQWIADYFLESEDKATPSEWCRDPTWGEDNCCAYCSDSNSVMAAEESIVSGKSDMDTTEEHESDTNPDVRTRIPTERGREWKLTQLGKHFKFVYTQWRKQSSYISVLLSDSKDCDKIRHERDQLQECVNQMQTYLDEMLELDEHCPLADKFESISNDHHKLLYRIVDTLKDLESDRTSVRSNRTFKSAQSGSRSQPSLSSSASRVSAHAQAASLKVKLKYIDSEAKSKAELERVQTLKEIEMAEAKIQAIDQASDPFLSDIKESNIKDIPSASSAELVHDFFIKSQPDTAPSKPVPSPTSLQPSIPVTINSHNVNVTQSSLDRATSAVMTSSLTPDVNSSLRAPDYTSKLRTKRLNPDVPPFVPPVNYPAPDATPGGNTYADQNLSPSVNQGLVDLAKSLADQVALNRLPSPEPNIFYGDPIQYPAWKTSFKTLIDSRNIPPHERIHYLKRYIGGSVKQVIENYFLCVTDNSYEEAKKLLDERYGDPFVIASAFRDKLDSWPKIQGRDSVGLLRFSDFLRQCLTGMADVSSLDVLNDCRENRKMLAKLPEWLVSRWNRIVSNHKEETKSFPSFKRFVEFVCKEAKIATDPVTSLQSLKGFQEVDAGNHVKGKPVQRGPLKSVRGRSFLSSSKDTGRSSHNSNNYSVAKPQMRCCTLCKGAHDLNYCKSFLEKPLADRKAFVRESNLCFGCLGSGHLSRACVHRKTCKICSKLHPTVFHGDSGRPPVNPPESQSPPVPNPDGVSVKPNPRSESQGQPAAPAPNPKASSGATCLSQLGVESKCSSIVPVYLSHSSDPDNERLIYALLDSQSDTTFALRDTCSALGVSGKPVNLCLSTMHAVDKIVSSEKIKGLLVRGFNSTDRICLPDTYTRDIMPANRSHIPTSNVAREWPHLENIAPQLMAVSPCEIGLLIGYNCPRALIPREVIPPVGDGPFAQRTDLGWSIVGIVSHSSLDGDAVGLSHRILSYEVCPELRLRDDENTKSVLFSVRTSVKEEVASHDILRALERDFHYSAEVSSSLSQEDVQFLSILKKGVYFSDGHYQLPLPFRNPNPVLPNNRASAIGRTKSLQRRLQSDEKFRGHYTQFMTDLISKGHAERVTNTCSPNDSVWYVPHHGVYHPHKPDKIRVVFDCSSVYQGHSLNQHLLQGPDLTNKLFGVLCRFRKDQVAVMCDIEQMFHQFKVTPECRDYLRFLWWDSEDLSKEPVDFRMTVHLFGASSSPGCSNFGLKKIAQDNRDLFGDAAADFILRDFYVDDGVKSLATVSDAINLVEKTKAMCSKGGLRLHKFVSNKKEVLQALQPEERAKDLANIDLVRDKLPVERALGMSWCVESDTFQFKIVLKDRPLTRRGILSSVGCLYDPLGLIAPVVLTGKRILQQMCADKADWDDPLPEHLHVKWQQWRDGLNCLSSVRINRCVKPEGFGEISKVEMHHFSDASFAGYGQCSYIRFVSVENKVHCALLMGKSRVIPLKPITVPRLELIAATLSIKNAVSLQEELQFENVEHVYWTDSKVVIGYVCNEARRFHVFVANRVQQIRDHSKPIQWHHVTTGHNPADIASRGIQANQLVDNQLWFNGPSFLWELNLPLSDDNVLPLNENDPEIKKSKSYLVGRTDEVSSFPSLLERLEYFSCWYRAKKAVALCLRLKRKLREGSVCVSSSYDKKHLLSSYQPITVQEISEAERVIFKVVQAEAFKNDIEQLKQLK